MDHPNSGQSGFRNEIMETHGRYPKNQERGPDACRPSNSRGSPCFPSRASFLTPLAELSAVKMQLDGRLSCPVYLSTRSGRCWGGKDLHGSSTPCNLSISIAIPIRITHLCHKGLSGTGGDTPSTASPGREGSRMSVSPISLPGARLGGPWTDGRTRPAPFGSNGLASPAPGLDSKS